MYLLNVFNLHFLMKRDKLRINGVHSQLENYCRSTVLSLSPFTKSLI